SQSSGSASSPAIRCPAGPNADAGGCATAPSTRIAQRPETFARAIASPHARAPAACLREALLGARERALPSFAPKRRELLVHQTQRALQRAVIVLHQAVRGLARRAAQVGMLEPRADRVRELRRVLDLLRGAALEREARDLLE